MPRRSTASLLLAALLGWGGLCLPAHGSARDASAQVSLAEGESPGGDKLPKCVHVRTEARYVAYGYDHVVSIENGCDKAMSCVVRTDVNSDRAALDVPAGQARDVTTFRGSPAREFKADVTCKSQS